MSWKGRFESISKSCLAVSTRMQNHISHHHKALALESAFSKIESLKILKRNVRNSLKSRQDSCKIPVKEFIWSKVVGAHLERV